MKEKYFANAHLPKVVTNAKMRMRYIIVQVHVYYTDRTHTISSCDNVLSKPLSDGSVRLTSRGRRGDRFSFFNLSSCIQKQFPLKSAPSISCHTLFHYWEVQRYSLRPRKSDVLWFKICPRKNDVLSFRHPVGPQIWHQVTNWDALLFVACLGSMHACMRRVLIRKYTTRHPFF